ncbi:MAG: carboxypeptidase regulatory-like domain-containing protein [Coriobacteriia bacterium]|nr:carboxypeptidase regulatory-like domain-containing protein [Coriobacteriia bacterium]
MKRRTLVLLVALIALAAMIPAPVFAQGTSVAGAVAGKAIGDTEMSASVTPNYVPVYRFSDMYNGATLYTANLAEAIDIINNYWDVYLYEGVAFLYDPAVDTAAIYRMHNVETDTFLYAGLAEANQILTYYPTRFTSEGVAFYLSWAPGTGKIPIYRFLGPGLNSQFLTASETERAAIQSGYPATLMFEGTFGYVSGGLQLGSGTGSISGVVTGPGNAPLSGVWVRASLEDDSGTWFARTNGSGAYSITGLPAGSYLVTFSTWPNNFDSGWTIIPDYYPGDVAVASATNTPNINIRLTRLPQPVYRFFNFTNGTHFFTPSEDEANNVIDQWSDIFEFEGVAYYTNPDNNTQPLYRFFNRNSGSHFYTASLDEANYVIATWPHVFTFDGPTYSVSRSPVANSVPVYRFFNRTNGSHFYTASAEEADTVIATWPHIYTFEGPAFWIGQ